MRKVILSFVLLTGICYPQSLYENLNRLDKNIGKLSRVLDIRNKIDDQFVTLTEELLALHDPAVTKVIKARWPKIVKLSEELEEAAK